MIFWFLSCAAEPPAVELPNDVQEEILVEEEEQKNSNRRPSIVGAQFFPKRPGSGDRIQVEVETADPDGDNVRLSYSWSVNDKPLPSVGGAALASRWFVKNDKVNLKIVASDGKLEVKKRLSVKISNTSPIWVKDPRKVKKIDGFKVEAKDPDGDAIQYRLQGAPLGMKIDPDSGVLSYKGALDEPGGQYNVVVIADDQDGGELRWSFEIKIAPGSKGATSSPK